MTSSDLRDLSDDLGRVEPITPAQTHAARLAVAAHATSPDDARLLLATLGLDKERP